MSCSYIILIHFVSSGKPSKPNLTRLAVDIHMNMPWITRTIKLNYSKIQWSHLSVTSVINSDFGLGLSTSVKPGFGGRSWPTECFASFISSIKLCKNPVHVATLHRVTEKNFHVALLFHVSLYYASLMFTACMHASQSQLQNIWDKKHFPDRSIIVSIVGTTFVKSICPYKM